MAKSKKSVFSDPHFLLLYVCAAALLLFVLYVHMFGDTMYILEKKQHRAQQVLQEYAQDGKPTRDEVAHVIALYKEAISERPLSGEAAKMQFTIARLYLMHAQYAEAIDELKGVILNFSQKAQYATEARFQMGKIYEAEDKWDEALASYKEIYEYHPLSQKGMYIPLYIAERFKARGDMEGAQDAYEKAFRQYEKLLAELGNISNASVVYNYIALTYASQGQWKKAVEQWEGIVRDYPEHRIVPATLMTLGELYANRLKQAEKATERYTKVVNDFPEDDLARQAHIRLIQLYFSTTDYEKAREWCEKIIEREKDSDNEDLLAETTLLLARTYEKEGMWGEAEETYSIVETMYPDSAAAMRVPLIKAKHFQDGNKIDEANRLYERAMIEYQRVVSSNPDTSIAVNAQDLMSLIYVNQKNWTGLLTHIEDLLSSTDDQSARHAQLLFLKANILNAKMGDTVTARAVYQQFLIDYPGHPLEGAVQKQIDTIDNPDANPDQEPLSVGLQLDNVDSLSNAGGM